jgi:peptide/nickel transport system ATP-binding protein
MTALVEIEDLRTEIRLRRSVVRAVDCVSLSVAAGECLGIVGESGSGKTMTALSVMRLLPAGGAITGGRIRVAGTDVTALTDDAMRQVRGNAVGMVFQDPLTSLNPTMTIGDQIAESVLLHRGASRAAAMARAVEVLGLVGMPRPAERVGNYPHQLSGGMRQRVMIAMALACEPRLLIADEPTTALDVTIQKQILELIDSLRQELGMAVILVTHDLGVIAGRADRVAVMYAGRIVETTSTEKLFARPRHPYTEALFSALPEKAAGVTRLYNIPGQPPDLTAPSPGCKFAPRCRYAQAKCEELEPSLTNGGDSHEFRCFFPVGAIGGASALAGVPGDAALAGVSAAASTERRRETPPAAATVPGEGALLRVEHLVKDFAVTAGAVLQRKVGVVSAVADVSFGVPRGSTFGLVGESGCGKTTIGRLIVGLEKPSGGRISLGGEDLAQLSRRDRRRRARTVSLMFQDSYASMDPRMRVGTILREPLVIQRDGSRSAQAARVAAMLDEVGLPAAAAQRYPHEFSGGQRQRLGLARALIAGPSLIVADEPVSALDVSIQAQILNLMRDLQREHGLTYLFISHDLSVVRYMADTIGVMYLGKLVETGPAAAVYSAPVHPYTKGLIETVQHRGVTGELPSARTPPSGCRFRTRCPRAQELCAVEEPPLRTFSGAPVTGAPVTGAPVTGAPVTGATANGAPVNGATANSSAAHGAHRAACHFPLRDPEPTLSEHSPGQTRTA